MKFLSNVNAETQEVLPINFLYYHEHEYDVDDELVVVYKDVATGKKFLEQIKRPKIQVWIVKKEFRNLITTNRDWIKKEYLEPRMVRYRNRYSEIAKILGLPNRELSKTSPWVLMSNMDIRTYYCIQFALEYKLPEQIELNMGFYDIENDVIDIAGFPDPGRCPINVMTFMDESANIVYQFIREPDAPAFTINPKTGKTYDNRDQIQYLKEHVDDYIKDCDNMFSERYGKLEYHILFYKDEVKMIHDFFAIVAASEIDIAEAWNAPYDLSNLTLRPEYLMTDPSEVVCDNRFDVKECKFIEDKNPVVWKKKHKIQISHPTVFIDMMQIYAGLRSGQGKIPSLKLGVIAKQILKDDKLHYEDEGDIKTIPYVNFWKFALYNMNDVLLLAGIHRATHDIDDAYGTISTDAVLPNEVFTSTAILTDSVTLFLYRHGYIAGNNRNKFRTSDYNAYQDCRDEMDVGHEFDENYEDYGDGASDNEPVYTESDDMENITQIPIKKGKKQFEGAMVQDPNRMLTTGTRVMGSLNSKIHEHVIDEDVTSLYPTLMIIMNMSNETLIGRIEIADDMYDYFFNKYGQDFINKRKIANANQIEFTPSDVNEYVYQRLPMYNYDFIGEDKNRYKLNISDTVLMDIAEDAIIELGKTFMNLPGFDEIESSHLVNVKFKNIKKDA